jgi:hypothetical protein
MQTELRVLLRSISAHWLEHDRCSPYAWWSGLPWSAACWAIEWDWMLLRVWAACLVYASAQGWVPEVIMRTYIAISVHVEKGIYAKCPFITRQSVHFVTVCSYHPRLCTHRAGCEARGLGGSTRRPLSGLHARCVGRFCGRRIRRARRRRLPIDTSHGNIESIPAASTWMWADRLHRAHSPCLECW